MRVQTEEWRRFIPGVRMYKGKKTLFYNGEILWEGGHSWDGGNPLIYDREERGSWEVIIVLPGIEIIPEYTFYWCKNLKTVIVSDSVRRIEFSAFLDCENLFFVKLSRNLEFIGDLSFYCCKSLTSVFIPPSCRQIGEMAFNGCEKLKIFSIPQHTQLVGDVFENTALFDDSLFEENSEYDDNEKVNRWIKNVNTGREYSLHRLCCSTYENEALPISEAIYQEVKEQGPKVLQTKNRNGITPLKYLEENPYLENIDEMKMLKRYIAEKMGQVAD